MKAYRPSKGVPSVSYQNNRTHRIQTPVTHLQSTHNHPTSISPPSHLCSTSSQHSLFISRYPHSTTNIILVTYGISDRSFWYASPCLWNHLPSYLRQPVLLSLICLFMLLPHLLSLSTHHSHHLLTSFQSVCLWPACSCSYHIFSVCQLTLSPSTTPSLKRMVP